MVTTAQMNRLLNVQQEMLKVMKATKPVVEATTKAMDDFGESSKKTEDNIKRVESGLGRFIKNTIRAQEGFKGGMHRLLYGVGGYFKFKNTMDATLSIIDNFIVRPLSGLKDENDKEGAIGRIMYGVGGSYQKTKKQLESTANIGKKALGLIGEQFFRQSIVGTRGKTPMQRAGDKRKELDEMTKKFFTKAEMSRKLNAKFEKFKTKSVPNILEKLKSFATVGITLFVLALKIFTFGLIALTALFFVAKFLKRGGLDITKLKEIGAVMQGFIEEYGMGIWEGIVKMKDGLMMMFNAIFGDGSLEDLLDGYILFFSGLWEVVKNAFLVVAMPIVYGLIELLLIALEGFKIEAMEKLTIVADLANILVMIITGIGLVIVGVGLFMGSAVVILTGLVIAITGLLGKFSLGFLGFADGGVTNGSMSMVGERGPELVRLPKGSRVHSNTESKKMLAGGGGNNITVNVQGRIGASDSELRQIAQKVGQMINKEINRTTSSRGLGA